MGKIIFPYYDDLEDELGTKSPLITFYNSYTQMRPLK